MDNGKSLLEIDTASELKFFFFSTLRYHGRGLIILVSTKLVIWNQSMDTHRIVRMEDVWGRWVVYYNHLVQVSSQTTQILRKKEHCITYTVIKCYIVINNSGTSLLVSVTTDAAFVLFQPSHKCAVTKDPCARGVEYLGWMRLLRKFWWTASLN